MAVPRALQQGHHEVVAGERGRLLGRVLLDQPGTVQLRPTSQPGERAVLQAFDDDLRPRRDRAVLRAVPVSGRKRSPLRQVRAQVRRIRLQGLSVERLLVRVPVALIRQEPDDQQHLGWNSDPVRLDLVPVVRLSVRPARDLVALEADALQIEDSDGLVKFKNLLAESVGPFWTTQRGSPLL